MTHNIGVKESFVKLFLKKITLFCAFHGKIAESMKDTLLPELRLRPRDATDFPGRMADQRLRRSLLFWSHALRKLCALLLN